MPHKRLRKTHMYTSDTCHNHSTASGPEAVAEPRTQERWTFDPEDLSFLVKAFEPEYFCESQLHSTLPRY